MIMVMSLNLTLEDNISDPRESVLISFRTVTKRKGGKLTKLAVWFGPGSAESDLYMCVVSVIYIPCPPLHARRAR